MQFLEVVYKPQPIKIEAEFPQHYPDITLKKVCCICWDKRVKIVCADFNFFVPILIFKPIEHRLTLNFSLKLLSSLVDMLNFVISVLSNARNVLSAVSMLNRGRGFLCKIGC